MKHLAFALAMILALPLSAWGQQFDNPVTVPVSYYCTGNVQGQNGAFSVGSTQVPGQPTDSTFPVSAGSGSFNGSNTTASSELKTAFVIPGKEYDLTVTSSQMNVVAVNFTNLQGCEVYIYGIKRDTYNAGTNYPVKVRVERINDITGSLAGQRGGQCSSFPEDKPIWYIGLGSLRNGRFAGGVGFRRAAITPDLFTTRALVYDSVDISEIPEIARSNGAITRIDSRDVVLMIDPYNATSTSYNIRAYTPIDLSTPFITYTVRQYTTGGVNGIRIDKVEDGVTWSTVLYQLGATWTLYDWQKVADASTEPTGNVVTTAVNGSTSTVSYGSGTGMVTKQKTYTTVNGRTELASATWGPGTTSAPSRSYTYYADSSGDGWAQAVQAVTDSTGGWTKYDYFNTKDDRRDGLVRRIYRPWLDAPATPGSANTGNCYVETYDYATSGPDVRPSRREVQINNVPMGLTVWGYNWAYSSANGYTVMLTQQDDYSSATASLPTTTLSYRPDSSVPFLLRDRPHSVTRPDGTRDAYAYFNGSWNPTTQVYSANPDGGARKVLIFHGQKSAGSGGTALSSWSEGTGSQLRTWQMDTVYLVPNLSTVTETVTDAHGRVVFTGEYVYTVTSGAPVLERIAAQANTFNTDNLLSTQRDLVRSVPSGDVAVSYTYTAGLLASKTDVDGGKTIWDYDNYLRNTKITSSSDGTGSYPKRIQNFTYFSSNRKNTAQESDASPAVTTYSYEPTGRLATASEPKPGGGTLTTTYSYPSPQQTTVTMPTGAARTSTRYLDGRPKSETGNGQVNTSTSYTFDGTTFTKISQHGVSLANGWLEEKSDWLGRTTTQRTPQVTWSSRSTKVTRKTFSYSPTTGQLVSTTTVDEGTSGTPRLVPDHRYVYGDLGLLSREGDDVSGNGALDDVSNDRITLYATSYSKEAAGSWIRQETAQVFRDATTNAMTTVLSRRTRLTLFNGGALDNSGSRVISDVEETDASGRKSTTLIASNATARSRTKDVATDGATQHALTKWQDGYLQSDQSASGVTQTYTYDTAGLLSKVTEGTTNAATSYNYYAGTNYVSSTVQTIGASANATTSYVYTWTPGTPSMTVKTTDAVSNAAYTEFNALGLPWRTWGTAAQPTLTTYDAYGRRTNLTTWQSGTFTGATWPANPPTGNVVTWNVDPATGAIASKLYPNGSTVGFTYNARGQLKTRTWARTPTVTTTYSYYDSGVAPFTGELKQVSYSDPATPNVSYTYTRVGALATVADAAGTRTFNYRNDLLPDTEVFGAYYGSRTLTASYDSAIAGRPTGYSFNGTPTVSATIGYYAGSGRPSTIAGALGGTDVSFTLNYSAGTDWVNSVTSGSYSRTTPLVSKYDVIASATTKWGSPSLGSFTAQYADARGWRTGQDNGSASGTPAGSWTKLLNLGDGFKSGTATYDGFGQLTGTGTAAWQASAGTVSLASRNLTWTYDLAGNRKTETDTATTTYGTADTNPNAFGSLNQYESITGQRAESTLAYDGDGNLIQDGTWTYAYDAENRLKSVTKPGQTLSFTYDYLGRRIRKTVTGTGAYDIKFLWTGWTLAAELAADGATVNKAFVWGRDFSDARGDAGGAGSLLAQISGSTVSYAIPDAFGTIVGYISGGAIALAVEYSPYGKGVNAYGTLANYPIGFSGQYMDWEAGLVYYGLRYYAPKHGRFINRDPIEEAGGNNLYGYCGNSALHRWDTLGLSGMLPNGYDLPSGPRTPAQAWWDQYVYSVMFTGWDYNPNANQTPPGSFFPWLDDANHGLQARGGPGFESNSLDQLRDRLNEGTSSQFVSYGPLTDPVTGQVYAPATGQIPTTVTNPRAPNGPLRSRPEIVTEDMLIRSSGPDGSVFGTDPWTGKTVILKSAPGLQDDTAILLPGIPALNKLLAGAGSILSSMFGRAAETTTARLQGHMQSAMARVEAEGLTAAQQRALIKNPGLEAAYRGDRIDTLFKDAVRLDPKLQHLEITPRYKFGPDVFDPATQKWWDVTTPAQWQPHVEKYWLFGEGTPLLTR